MLQLRPTCENCNAALPPNSADAMICTFECTFCRSCVENILDITPGWSHPHTRNRLYARQSWIRLR
ncbi:MAG: hypothetical protein DMF19_14500 [Verrucomicrobia bacterium]|nr:MAG: hypothetical protein DMF19_14500 [Verrucomicrobiota bacterium]